MVCIDAQFFWAFAFPVTVMVSGFAGFMIALACLER